jgi:protein phosphatase
MTQLLSAKETFSLLEQAYFILQEEPNCIAVKSDTPMLFVGDTHGDYDTTEAVFSRFLGTHRLVFLGDYVDRASKHLGSFRNITFALEQKVKHPETVHLLRGNHEFADIFNVYGFGEELVSMKEGQAMYQSFKRAFAAMPYVVETENGLIGLHGGMPNIKARAELQKLPKGLDLWSDNRTISQIVWNDNVLDSKAKVGDQGIKNSPRGGSLNSLFVYGEPFFSQKMNLIGKQVLVRGHDYDAKGYGLDDRILTIFTSQRYAYDGRLKGVYVAVMDDPQKELNTAKDLKVVWLDR